MDADILRKAQERARWMTKNAFKKSFAIDDITNENTEHLTDAGNAEHLAKMFGNKLRYDHRMKRWLVWNNTIWIPDCVELVKQMAIESAKDRSKQALSIADSALRQKAVTWAIQSESAKRIRDSHDLARSMQPIASKGDEWDNNEDLLGCPNGVIDLRTGELRPGRQEDNITMTTRTNYNPNAQAPRWMRFLDEIFQGDAALIDYTWRALGYSIGASTREQLVFLGYGTGSNGKGKLFNTIHKILGDYSFSAAEKVFVADQNSISNDLAALNKKRFVINSEALAGKRINLERIKALSGEDVINARFLYKEGFEFIPTCKLWIYLNDQPIIDGYDYATWRRFKSIPFRRKFEIGKDADNMLSEKLEKEHEGILAWLVKGHLEWRKRGLKEIPEAITQATGEFKDSNDPLTDFISECCIVAPEKKRQTKTVFESYITWCMEQGLHGDEVLSKNMFGRVMSHKFTREHQRGGWYYVGIDLNDSSCDVIPLITSHDVTYSSGNPESISRETIYEQFTEKPKITSPSLEITSPIRHTALNSSTKPIVSDEMDIPDDVLMYEK